MGILKKMAYRKYVNNGEMIPFEIYYSRQKAIWGGQIEAVIGAIGLVVLGFIGVTLWLIAEGWL